jgi:hypothetical protein
MEKYRKVSQFGAIYTEFIIEKKWFRILIGSFLSLSEAQTMRAACIGKGFAKAFIVKYQDGIRVGMMHL